MIFEYGCFNLRAFLDFIMQNFYLNCTYSILVTIGLAGNTVFYTVGRQIGIGVLDSHDLEYYENVYDIIKDKIYNILSNYDVNDYPNIVVIRYKVLNQPPELFQNQKTKKQKNVFNQSVLTKFELSVMGPFNYLPLSFNSSSLGLLIMGDLRLKYLNTLKSLPV